MKTSRERIRGLSVGLTGGIACGKSEVGRLLAESGFVTSDADELAHRLLDEDETTQAAVREKFGTDVFGTDGSVDRAKLGRLVFADNRARERLESILHPAVLNAIRVWLAAETAKGKNAVAMVPLLYEKHIEGWFDHVICVTSPEPAVMERLAGRGLSRDEARQRIAAQMSVEAKAQRTRWVIRNDGSLEDLKRETEQLIRRMLNKEH